MEWIDIAYSVLGEKTREKGNKARETSPLQSRNNLILCGFKHFLAVNPFGVDAL
jgi:hypothetical protein